MGFDTADNYSTARDLAILSLLDLKIPLITEATSHTTYTIKSESGIDHEYISTNKLLGDNLGIAGLKIKGLKTGSTPEAGECLITNAIYPNGKQILTIVLGSADRFNDTRLLVNWLNNSYHLLE
ncbi:MAG: D,D carboxypeptidase, D-alanyl-D-alanine carboxypeptidase (penicillin-binding protein 5/6) [Candidatus Peregrinibacteria bacterium GW2011_GWE2_39_6]|nr:MAG: D,D carboxypeptidase, D-alanyl-D-alanine carboxypeptidase (penicillin-binding protein 5/6) [Candidatus Peregrinibacteria bacterium GW2011_GWE2_39_6]